MGNYISKADKFSGRLANWLLSLLYKGINTPSLFISMHIYGKKKLKVKSFCILNRCYIRIDDSASGISIGSNCKIENNAFLNAHSGSIKIGDNCFVGPNTIIQGLGNVEIGNHVLISGNVFISSSNHQYSDVPASEFLKKEDGKSVVIADNVWIGSNVTVTAGVTIGQFSIVGAGSVVTRNIEPYSIAFGNPARMFKKLHITSEGVIKLIESEPVN